MAEAVAAGARSVEGCEVAHLAEADAIIFGTPTRFGTMAAQMRNFLDQTGTLGMEGGLVGKVGSVFASTASQHGGQETTITSFHSTLVHHGMIIVGVPYSEQRLLNKKEISGPPTAPPLWPERTTHGNHRRMNLPLPVSREPMWRILPKNSGDNLRLGYG